MKTNRVKKQKIFGFEPASLPDCTPSMEKKMEATIVYCGYIGDNGKENGNYYSILGVCRG